jgi:hypothetical protein
MLYAPITVKTFAVRAAELIRGKSESERNFPDNHAWIDFRGPPNTFRTYPLVDVVQGRISPGAFHSKIVLVGVTDPGEERDVYVTAVSSKPMSGVEIQANSLATILNGFPLRPVGGAVTILLVFAMAVLPGLLACLKVPGMYGLVASVGTAWCSLAGAQVAFNSGKIVPVLYPVAALSLATIGTVSVDAFVERQQRERLEAVLGWRLPRNAANAANFFISYRRDQHKWQARELTKELARRFGDQRVFMDTTAISPGQRWPRRIDEAINECRFMLVLIGPYWLARNPAGERRIDDPDDWVRREIEGGLRRAKRVAVVPVLLDGAKMPDAKELPASVRPLADRQCVELSGERLEAEIDDLVDGIEEGRLRDLFAEARAADRRSNADEPS